jgi:uncharacterized protein
MAESAVTVTQPAKIDLHVHLAGTGCNHSGCWISPRFQRRYTFRALRWLYRIGSAQMVRSADRDWVARVAALVQGSELDYAVVLGFDAVYAPETGQIDIARSQLMVPEKWVFRVCRETPGLLPGPSINPYRAGAVADLERAIENKAVLLKWLPAAQAIDPCDTRLGTFYQVMARAGLPLLVHMGGERTFTSIAPEFNDLSRLRFPLEQGVKVICAHSATPLLLGGEPNQLTTLEAMLGQYPHLWVDNSGLCNPSRFIHLPYLARHPVIEARTLHGSDWPVPTSASLFLPRMGTQKTLEIARVKNALQRDIEIKSFFGYSEQTLTRANEVLAHLEHWRRRG